MDYDYPEYIEYARNKANNSTMIWASVNSYILDTLEKGKKAGQSLEEVAGIFEQFAGEPKKNEPVCISHIRSAAKQIRARKELLLI